MKKAGILSVALCVAMLCGCANQTASDTSAIEDLESKYNALQSELESAQAKIEQLESETEKTLSATAAGTTEQTTADIADIIPPALLTGFEFENAKINADTVANRIKTYTITALTMADAGGHGMKQNGTTSVITLQIVGGVWSAQLTNTENFDNWNGYSWEENGKGSLAGEAEAGVKNATEKLEISLANSISGVSFGYAQCLLYNGACVAVYFVPDLIEQPAEVADIFGVDGWNAGFSWGDSEGLTESGIVVGTNPKIKK